MSMRTQANIKQDRYNDYFMESAKRTAQLSYAVRLKVGSVAVRDNRIILSGFNGMPPGMDNACEEREYMGSDAGGWLDPDEIESQWPFTEGTSRYRLKTKSDVMHSEENLILYAAKEGISLKGAHLYCTHAPCINCARMIYGSGITKLYFNEVYHSTQGVDFLRGKIDVNKYEKINEISG